MAAVAELKAVLAMDSTAYKAGADGAISKTRELKSNISQNADQIRRSSSVANGFAAILKGDVAGGLNQIGEGMKTVTGEATKMALAIGAIGAAGGAGYRVGSALDNWLGISDKISKFVTRTTDQEREQAAALDKLIKNLRDARTGSENAAAIRTGTVDLKDARLKGLDKLENQKARETSGLEKAIAQAKTADEKKALAERLDAVRSFYDEDIAAFKKAEEDKAKEKAKQEAKRTADIVKQRDKSVAAEQERGAERVANVRGVGVSADSMARVGGIFSNNRTDLAGIDKRDRIMQEQLDTNKKILDIMNDFNEKLTEGTAL